MRFCTSDIFYSFVEAVEIFNKTTMCRIKSEIYSTKVDWTWASKAKIQKRTHMVPICDPYGFAHVGTTWNRVANPIPVPYEVPI